jgi:uncharacterized protein
MTTDSPTVARLSIYPIKSLDSVDVSQATVLASGALRGDRRWALVDASGHFVNGKRNAHIHTLRAVFREAPQDGDSALNSDDQNSEPSWSVSLRKPNAESVQTFHLTHSTQSQMRDATLEAWLADYFGFPITIQQNLEMGFPDDTASPGPTIISTATLEAIATWYPHLDVAEVRRRFRANIEISGVPAFWEDRLFTQAEATVRFSIGAVQFLGVNPCQRCVVVTRDSQTGTADPQFQKTFVAQRQATLPTWVERSRFNHFYRLAINTRLPATEAGKTLHLGDVLTLHHA